MSKARIMVIDDDPLMRNSTQEILRRAGYDADAFTNGQDGINALEANDYQLILCDMKMPGLSGLEVLDKVKSINEIIPFIVMTAYGTIETAVSAMRKGAYTFIEKPVSSPDELEMLVARALEFTQLREENRSLRQQLSKTCQYVGQSKAMRDVDAMVKSIAGARSTVLITGESGTGKELVARAIHANSTRSARPFIKVNCAALPENLIESELFGHKKGAFTGAIRDTKGKFELASGGTLLLDEIGEMPLSIQSKLLRVLQEREIDKVGGEQPIAVDVRIIATTNRDLRKEIGRGVFREDLYYRLNVVPIHLAPLRERKEDVAELLDYFIKQFNDENGFAVEGADENAVAKLVNYRWPGNIRELQNMVERAVVLQKSGWLKPDCFPLGDPLQSPASRVDGIASGITVAEMEKRLIIRTLDDCANSRTKAADLLGISVRTLRNKLQEYGQAAPVAEQEEE